MPNFPATMPQARRATGATARRLGATGLALLLALPALSEAQAQPSRPPQAAQPAQPPQLRPTRDVAVTYRVQSGSQTPQTVPAAWLTSAQRLRLEPPGMPGWVLADLPASRAQMVMDSTRMVMRLPGKGPWPALDRVPPGARMTPAGSATVAGLRCNAWQISAKEGEGTVCLTPDGVLLRASGQYDGRQGTLEATQVTYGPQDPTRFQVPPGYQGVNLPQGLPPGLIPDALRPR